MSVSLPRIRTMSDMAANNNGQQVQVYKLKFKKMRLESEVEPILEERKKSLKTIKSDRMNSLERYSTVQEQREYRNEKIHLNLIQRKLLAGTYDEQKQTSNDLNLLKHKRDQIRNQQHLKLKDIDRIKYLIIDLKKEIQLYAQNQAKKDAVIDSLNKKYSIQAEKTQQFQENREVLEQMILSRQAANLILTKKTNEKKEELERLKITFQLTNNEHRQFLERCSNFESKLEQMKHEIIKDKIKRDDQLMKQKQKIHKRTESEIIKSEKSKQYIESLDQRQRKQEEKQFYGVYEKILANKFIERYCKATNFQLREKFQAIDHAYRSISSYKTFDVEKPHTFVERFLEHKNQTDQREKQINAKEKYIENLESKRHQLALQLENLQVQGSLLEQNAQAIVRQGAEQKENEKIHALKNQEIQNIDRFNLIRLWINRMLKKMEMKGQKKQKSISVINNFKMLAKEIEEEMKKAL